MQTQYAYVTKCATQLLHVSYAGIYCQHNPNTASTCCSAAANCHSHLLYGIPKWPATMPFYNFGLAGRYLEGLLTPISLRLIY